MPRSAVVQINLGALKHNLSIVKKYAPASKVMCALKANAYGHGLVESAKALVSADGFAVAHLSEALELRRAGIKQVLVVLQGPQSSEDVTLFEQHSITAVIHNDFQVSLLEHANLEVWVKVNTGMNRLGFSPNVVDKVLNTIANYQHVDIQGLFTHMADADFASSRDTTDKQLALLKQINHNNRYPLTIANSASLLHWPQAQQSWVRPGIMLYGVNPFIESAGIDSSSLIADLQPVMTLSATIIAINTCLQGQKVGYAGTWQAPRDSQIAIVSIGYGDGYPRHAKNGTPVLINGMTYPLVGRVSMDLIAVDITDSTTINLHDNVVLWGEQTVQGKKITLPVEKIAECADTIAYELMCAVYGRANYQYN